MKDNELAEEYEEKTKCIEIDEGRPKWHNLKETPWEEPENGMQVLISDDDGSIHEAIFLKNDGYKHPVFSEYFTDVSFWIEKEKILPKTKELNNIENLVDNSLGEFDLL